MTSSDESRLIDGLGNRCVFLDDGGQATCAIYEVRPERFDRQMEVSIESFDPGISHRQIGEFAGVLASPQGERCFTITTLGSINDRAACQAASKSSILL